jgi:hypothetical protein
MSERIVTFHVVSIIYTISSVYIVIVYAFGYRSAHIKKQLLFLKGVAVANEYRRSDLNRYVLADNRF